MAWSYTVSGVVHGTVGQSLRGAPSPNVHIYIMLLQKVTPCRGMFLPFWHINGVPMALSTSKMVPNATPSLHPKTIDYPEAAR